MVADPEIRNFYQLTKDKLNEQDFVIVESPAKSKTIGRYLGKDYELTASSGHVRDLPSSTMGVDVENNYKPRYISLKGKEKVIRELKEKAAACDRVLLATDPDRRRGHCLACGTAFENRRAEPVSHFL